jgi:hypothetical protein
MKKIILFAFFCSSLFAMPKWFLVLEPQSNNELIGYGVASSLELAKQNAMADIVKSISVNIHTQLDMTQSNIDGKHDKSISQTLKTQANATLSGVKTLQAENFDNLWYVALSYDNSPVQHKLKKLLPTVLKEQTQSAYLAQTDLFKTLNREIKTPLDYHIVRQNNFWQLQYGEIFLPLNQEEFYALFDNQTSQELNLKTNQTIYQPNDEMFFKLYSTSHTGYFSLLYVEHNGKVGVLFANQDAKKELRYPAKKSQEHFVVANPYGKTIEELYVLIYSNTPLDVRDFESVSHTYLDESNFNFDKLLAIMKHYQFATTKIKIRGEK